jgi:hypothetical protein
MKAEVVNLFAQRHRHVLQDFVFITTLGSTSIHPVKLVMMMAIYYVFRGIKSM